MATWIPGVLKPRGLYLQNQKLCVCNHITQLLSGLTFTVSLKINKASNPDLRKCQISPPPSPLVSIFGISRMSVFIKKNTMEVYPLYSFDFLKCAFFVVFKNDKKCTFRVTTSVRDS